MQREPVDSSLIKSIGYDPAQRKLEIEFRAGVWEYHDVPPEAANQLVHAESIGQFFLRNIKGNFKEQRVA